MNTKVKSVLRSTVVALALAAGANQTAYAVENRWTGGAGDHEWTSSGNWSCNRQPYLSDDVVFDQEGDLYVHAAIPAGSKYNYAYCHSISVNGGSVAIDPGSETFYFYTLPDTSTVYVVAGSILSISNRVEMYGKNGGPLAKDGEGTFYHYKGISSISPIVVRAGTFQNGSTSTRGYTSGCSKIYIAKGATYYQEDYNTIFDANLLVEMEEGATYRIQGYQNSGARFAGVEGGGCVYQGNGWSKIDLQLPAGQGRHVFSGTFESVAVVLAANGGTLAIGATNTLAKAYKVTGSRGLEFMSGVGGPFYLTDYEIDAGYPLVLSDIEGNPVTVVVNNTDVSTLGFAGNGNLYIPTSTKAKTLTGNQFQSTGTLGVTGATLNLGDGTAEHDFDLSTASALDTGSGQITVANAASTDFAGSVIGAGTFVFGGAGGSIGRLDKTGGSLQVAADTVLLGGSSLSHGQSLFQWTEADRKLTVRDGFFANDVTVNSKIPERAPTPDGFTLNAQKTGSELLIEGGEVYLKGYANAGVARLVLKGGVTTVWNQYQPDPFATAANPGEVRMDGGTLRASLKEAFQYAATPFVDADILRVTVGSRGGTFDVCNIVDMYGRGVEYRRPFVSAVPDGVTGDLRFRGMAEMRFHYPMALNGQVSLSGGEALIAADAPWPTDGLFFGSGDLRLVNTRLKIAARTASETLQIGGDGGKLVCDGAAELLLRTNVTDPERTVLLSGLAVRPGGALFLADANRALDGSGSTVKVTGGVATAADGRVLASAFSHGVVNSARLDFLGYDSAKGFVNFGNYVTSLDAGKDATAGLEEDVAVPADTTYAIGAVNCRQRAINLLSGSVLRIGDGVNPACLMLDFNSNVTGPGTVDFGAAPGVVVGTMSSGNVGELISARITGTGGITFVGPAELFLRHIRLGAANAYTGGTHVNGIRVTAENAGCFSSGDVILGAGDRAGGRITFKCEGGVWNNAFRMAGRGLANNEYGGTNRGQLEFELSGEVAGAVELTEPSYVCACAEGVEGEFSGVVSGDRLCLEDSLGQIKLSAHNTYTGGTYAVASTLALVEADSAGTGPVSLDRSTLVFENTAPMTIANPVSGTGRIVWAGDEVKFADRSALVCSDTLEVRSKTVHLSELPDFGVISNGCRSACNLVFGPGTHHLDGRELTGKLDLTVKSGAILDLDGASITVHRVDGLENIVNGTVTQTGDKGFLLSIY